MKETTVAGLPPSVRPYRVPRRTILSCVLIGLLGMALGVPPRVFADPVRVGFSPNGFPKGKSKSYPGGGDASGASSLTKDETKQVIDMLNKMFADAIGAGKIEVVPLEDNPGVERKLFVSGGRTGERGETSQKNKESFVYEGTLAAKEPAKSKRDKRVNAIVFAAKHEVIHLIGGLENSDHGWEVSQAQKDKLIKEAEETIKKQEEAVAKETNPELKAFNQAVVDRNKKLLEERKKLPVTPVNTFTDGEKVTPEEASDPASQTFPDRIKEALKKGVEQIQSGKDPKDNPDENQKLNSLIPLRGPNIGIAAYTDRHPDYGYTLESGRLGSNLDNPDLRLGLFDDAGEFVPFGFAPRGGPEDPLGGMMTLQAGHPYDFVLFDRQLGAFVHASSQDAQLAFDHVLVFDTANANPYDLVLSGPYFGRAFISYDLDRNGLPDARLTLESLNFLELAGGDGFIGPFVSRNPDAVKPIAAPMPAHWMTIGLGVLVMLGRWRGGRHAVSPCRRDAA